MSTGHLKKSFSPLKRAFKPVTSIFLIFLISCYLEVLKADTTQGWCSGGIEEIVRQVTPQTILLLGEIHDDTLHHKNQLQILDALSAKGQAFSVAMEFFSWPDQSVVDAYLKQQITEERFLDLIQWGELDFADYRPLVRAATQGWVYAINVPRDVTSTIFRSGISSLSADQRSLLPQDFTLGGEDYRQRMLEDMGDHIPPGYSFANFFAAQSAWDDTMAWQILKQKPADQAMVVIVGDYHVAFGQGLPHRLRQRGATHILTVSQQGQGSCEEDGKWGKRGDFLFLSSP